MSARKTKTDCCPTCLPDTPGAYFDLEYNADPERSGVDTDYMWVCRNCWHKLPYTPKPPRKDRTTPSQEKMVARLAEQMQARYPGADLELERKLASSGRVIVSISLDDDLGLHRFTMFCIGRRGRLEQWSSEDATWEWVKPAHIKHLRVPIVL